MKIQKLKFQTHDSSRPIAPAELISTEAELEEVLTHPSEKLVEFVKSISGPLMLLGAGGKMGPTLAVLARRAADEAGHRMEVLAGSRFTDEKARNWLEERGVKTISANLLEARDVACLPEAENVIYLVGVKFGTAQNPAATWAANTLVPARVCERYPKSRIVALSTGNVYPPSRVSCGGSLENDPLTPLGEYANAAVGRERIFEFYSRQQGTRVALLRLFYAVELRYGVLVDIARKIWVGTEIPLANGAFNCIWQGDANEMILRALALAQSPPSVWNLCRPEAFSVQKIALIVGELLDKKPIFTGEEEPTALLGNAARICEELAPPATEMETMLRWTAHWVRQGGRSLERPTHFEVRDGNY